MTALSQILDLKARMGESIIGQKTVVDRGLACHLSFCTVSLRCSQYAVPPGAG